MEELELELEAKVTLGGETYAMPISFGVARSLTLAGIVPGDIVAKSKAAMIGGPHYAPTHLELATALYLGASADGCKMTVEEIGEEIVSEGFEEYAAVFGAYMVGFMTGGLPKGFRATDMLDPGTKKKAKKKKRGKKKRTRGGG